MRCRRLHMINADPERPQGDLRTTNRQDPPTRPSWRDRQYRELKKLFFSPPRKCPIDPFGPLANRTVLEQLHGALLRSQATGSSARVLQRRSNCSVSEVLANRGLPHDYVRPCKMSRLVCRSPCCSCFCVEFAAAPPSGDAADAVSYVVRVADEPAHRSKTPKNRPAGQGATPFSARYR